MTTPTHQFLKSIGILTILGAVIIVVAQSVPAQPADQSLVTTYGVKINVDDMDKALAFYVDKLGFEVEDRTHRSNYVILKTPEHEKLVLNRVSRLSKTAPMQSGLSFTLQVNNLDEAMARMKSLGIEFGEREPRKEAVGNAISILDPFGRRISLMHQTIVKVEPFVEPRLYNYGFQVPDMQAARDFYSGKLGFVVRSERYLPLDLPLGHADKTFAFMLHYRPGVTNAKVGYPRQTAFNTLALQTTNLAAATERLRKNGVKILGKRKNQNGHALVFQDPFGNVSELWEVVF